MPQETGSDVTLCIDGKTVTVPDGSTILQAAESLDIRIPTLCHHWALEPYGACRVCTVEIRYSGRKRMVTACNYPVWDGIEVFTASPEVIQHRRMIVEFELGRCSTVQVLRDLADELGIDKSRFGQEKAECILCGLCVRMCDEVVGARAITFVGRGVDREVGTPYHETTDACIGCGACAVVCPTGVIALEDISGRAVLHQEMSLAPNKPIRVPSLQAVPNVPFIDADTCIHTATGECGICEQACPKEAVSHTLEGEEEEIEAGAVLISTGYQLMDVEPLLRYGYGRLDNVITGLEFETLCHASGPTGGKNRLADGRAPKAVAIIHCVGSRDADHHRHCSKVCCMYSMKFAHLVREKVDAKVYEFYIDIRAGGKGYEEFYERVLDEDVIFIRGKPAEITDWAQTPEEQGRLVVQAEDTLLGLKRRIPVDMVVLSPAMESRDGAKALAQLMGIACGSGDFYMERHPKLAPVETAADGIFLAGACQGPKDIPECVAQGAGAAAAILALMDRGTFDIEPITAIIDEELCGACKTCVSMCPYTAIKFDEEANAAMVEDAMCKGCGTCVAACPAGAAQQRGYTDDQLRAELEGALQLLTH